MEVAAAFFQASHGEGITNLSALLASGLRFHSAGGGKRPAVASILEGANEVVRAHAALPRLRHGQPELVRYAFVHGLPGFVHWESAGVWQTTALFSNKCLVRALLFMSPEALPGGQE